MPASGSPIRKKTHPGRLLLQWHVTERCNLRCAHCYQESYLGRDLPFDALLEILGQFRNMREASRFETMIGKVKHAGIGGRLRRLVGRLGKSGSTVGCRTIGHITLAGGEPILHPDFFRLLDAIVGPCSDLSFAVLSNGTLLDRSTIRRLRSLGPSFVQVSIEGPRSIHEEIRGRGSFDAAVGALSLLVREGVRSLIAFTAHRSNFRYFPEVARLGRAIGVARVWADRLIPAGAGSSLEPLTPYETREFLGILRQARAEANRSPFNRTEIALRRALQFLAGGGPPYRCTAGDTLLTILPDGTLYPCRRMPIPIGNVLDTPLATLYDTSEVMGALRDRGRVSKGCEQCPFARLCGGGLRCLSFAQTGDPFRADPGCEHAGRMANCDFTSGGGRTNR